jgi:hypothetical protein
MPNWVSNEMTISGHEEDLAIFSKAISVGDSLFASISPCPLSLRLVSTGGCTIDGESVNMWLTHDTKLDAIVQHGFNWNLTPEEREEHKGRYVNVTVGYEFITKVGECHGCLDWYSWALRYWGTKWDVTKSEVGGLPDTGIPSGADTVTLRFNTAWSPPEEWIGFCSEQFPTLMFENIYIDESNYCGAVVIREEDQLEQKVYHDSIYDYGISLMDEPCPDWDEDEDGASEWDETMRSLLVDALRKDLWR